MAQSTRERVNVYRAKLRSSGLRPVQIWVPDARRPGFAEECRRQSRLLDADPQEAEITAWLEEVSDADGWQ